MSETLKRPWWLSKPAWIAGVVLFAAGAGLGRAAGKTRPPDADPPRECGATFQAIDGESGEPVPIRVSQTPGTTGRLQVSPAADRRDRSTLRMQWVGRGPYRFTIASEGYTPEHVVLQDATEGITVVARPWREGGQERSADGGGEP